MKQVREMKAAGEISAYIVLDKKREHVATVQIHHGERCRVDIWAHGDAAIMRNAKAQGVVLSHDDDWEKWQPFSLQHGAASGYGYDKQTAAMSGLYIDGIRLFDHCGRDKASERALAAYQRDKEAYTGEGASEDQRAVWHKVRAQRVAAMKRQGLTFANGESSLFYLSGLDRLCGMGYKVIRAI